jgi:hypothetical protein
MRSVKLVVVMALSVLLVVAGSSPALAQQVRRADPHGDAPQSIDIWNARYRHATHRVSVDVKIPDLGDRGRASLSISRFTIFEAGYVVIIRKSVGEPARVRLAYYNHFDLEPRRCAGVTGSWGSGHVELGVPRSCLEGHARKRVFVQFGIQRGPDIDRARPVRRLARG